MSTTSGASPISKFPTRPPRDSKGWDGKLRIQKDPDPSDPSPPESDNEDGDAAAPPQTEVAGEELEADEGTLASPGSRFGSPMAACVRNKG